LRAAIGCNRFHGWGQEKLNPAHGGDDLPVWRETTRAHRGLAVWGNSGISYKQFANRMGEAAEG
jgi:hypothetical protein